MRSILSPGHAIRAGLLVLAGLGLACSSARTIRYRALLDDDRLASPPMARSLDSGAEIFADDAFLERRRLVQAVLDRNPNLEAARQGVRAALARVPQATSLEDPMLGLGAAPLSFGSSRVDAAGRIDVAQRLPFPGKRRLRGEAALSDAEALGRDLESMRLELATLASRLFDDLALTARSLAISEEHTALIGELQRTALARYASGEDSKQSVLQAELALSRALLERSALESNAALVAEQINALLHRAPALPLPPLPAVLAPPPDPEGPVDALIVEALDRHPELAAAGSREQAAEARVDLAKREFLPDFTLTGAYDALWQESPLAPFVGLQLNVPLQLGRRRAALDESRAELEGTHQRRLAAEDGVRIAVQSAAIRFEQARRAEQIVRDRLLPPAEEQVATARAAYAAGRSTFSSWIDATRELHEIELDHESTRADLGRARAELDRALGRTPGLTW